MRNKIKKILRESDDLDWIHDVPLNPFVGEPKTMVIWLDRVLNYSEVLYILSLLNEAGYHLNGESEYNINNIIKYSKTNGYIRSDLGRKIFYGDGRETLGCSISYEDITIDKEFKATDILPKNLNESDDDLKWIHDIPANPFVGEPRTIIVWLDRELDRNELLYILSLLNGAGYNIDNQTKRDIENIIEYSKTNGYIRTNRFSEVHYGRDKETLGWLIDYEAITVHQEYDVTDILPKNLNESDDDLQWIHDVPTGISHPFLIVNDLDDGIGIQKFLLSLGYTWHSKDTSIRQIYDSTLGYSSLFKENTNSFGLINSALDYDELIEIAEEIMESKWEDDPDYEYRPNELTIYYWSQLKSSKLNENTNYDKDLDWIDNVPTPIPATELEEWDYFTINIVPDSTMEFIEEHVTKEWLFGNTFTIERPIEIDPLFRLYPDHLIKKYNLNPNKLIKNAFLVPTTEIPKKDGEEPNHGLEGLWVDLEGVWVNKLS